VARQVSAQVIAKAARPDRREGKNGNDDTSFAATIDSLGKDDAKTRTPVATAAKTDEASPDKTEAVTQSTTQTAPPSSTPTAGWAGFLTLKQIDFQQGSGDGSADLASLRANAAGVRKPTDLLKQQSIAALIDAKHAAFSNTDKQDALPVETDNSEIKTPVVVQSRETHWLFAAPVATATLAGPPSADKIAKAGAPVTLSAVRPARGQDDVSKSLSNVVKQAAPQTSPVAIGAAGDASPRQSFERQGGGDKSKPDDQALAGADNSKPHDQALAGTDNRKALEVPVTKSPSRIVPDAGDVSASATSVTQQVRTGVLDALSGDGAETTPLAAPQTADPRTTAPAQVLRSIDLTLSPPDLGTIRLRLTLKSNALDIDAEASKASTAKLLDDDRKGLEQSLRDAGYDVSSLKIADAAATGGSSLNNQMAGGSPFQDGSQARANLAGRQGGNLQQDNGSAPNQSQHRPRGNNPQTSPASDGAAPRQSNAIYI
jgi:hypothetical protein